MRAKDATHLVGDLDTLDDGSSEFVEVFRLRVDRLNRKGYLGNVLVREQLEADYLGLFDNSSAGSFPASIL